MNPVSPQPYALSQQLPRLTPPTLHSERSNPVLLSEDWRGVAPIQTWATRAASAEDWLRPLRVQRQRRIRSVRCWRGLRREQNNGMAERDNGIAERNTGMAERANAQIYQPVFLSPAEMPLMVAVMARSSSTGTGCPLARAARLRRSISTWISDIGST